MPLATTNLRSSPPGPVSQKPTPARQSPQPIQMDADELSGLIGQRHQLVGEMESLHERRLEIAQKLKVTSGDEARVLERIASQIDQRLSGAETALSAIERAIASSTGAPAVAAAPQPIAEKLITQGFAYAAQPPNTLGKSEAMVGGGALLVVAIVVAATVVYVRRLRRDVQRLSVDLWGEVKKVSVGIDAIAVELERIGEGQRYVTKQIAEKKVPVERG